MNGVTPRKEEVQQSVAMASTAVIPPETNDPRREHWGRKLLPSADPESLWSRLSGSLSVLIAAAVLPVFIVLTVIGVQLASESRSSAEQELRDLSRALRVAFDAELTSGLRFADALSRSEEAQRQDWQAFDASIRRMLPTQPNVNSINVADLTTGRYLVHTTLPPGTRGAPAGPNALEQGRIVAETKQATIFPVRTTGPTVSDAFVPLRAPIMDGDTVVAVLTVALDSRKLSALYDKVEYNQSWTSAFVDPSYRIAARNRALERFVGRVVNKPAYDALLQGTDGIFRSINQEGEQLYSVFSRSPETSWSVIVGVPADEIDGPLHRMMLVVGGLGLLGAGAGVGTAAHLAKRMRATRAAEQQQTALLEALVAQRSAELERNNEQLHSITDNLPFLISYTDKEQRIRFINQGGARWFNRPVSEIIGKTMPEITGRKPTIGRAELLQRLTKGPIRLRRTRSFPDGRTRSVERQILPDFAADGTLRGYYTLASDLTDQVAAEETIQHLQKMDAVGQLTSGVAHDFNNLLGIIVANLDMMEPTVRDRPATHKWLTAAISAVERGASLTRQLLAFARKQSLQPEQVDAGQLLSDITELLKRTLGEPVCVSIITQPDLWHCFADKGQVENAIINLALNARDAMPQGGDLKIEATNVVLSDAEARAEKDKVSSGRYVCLSIKDTGTGMPPEVLERVLEPFFTTKEVGKGSGLGLSMVYGLVKQLGGFLRLTSAPGHGTTVRLFLPAAQTAETLQSRPAPRSIAARGEGQAVLVVEDNPAMLTVTVAMLEKLGYTALDATNAAEAMDQLRRRPEIAVLLTDVLLPGGINGFELARDAKKLRPDLKVVYASGFSGAGQVEAGSVGEKIERLNKPFRLVDLAACLGRVVGDGPRLETVS